MEASLKDWNIFASNQGETGELVSTHCPKTQVIIESSFRNAMNLEIHSWLLDHAGICPVPSSNSVYASRANYTGDFLMLLGDSIHYLHSVPLCVFLPSTVSW